MSKEREKREGARLTVLGSGDAFNSGARFNAAYLVEAPGHTFLVECGPTSLLALKRKRFDAREIDFVLVSHLHGDHFGGLPALLLEYVYEAPRRRPLLIGGPPGIEDRVRSLFGLCYREVAGRPLPFPLEFRELRSGSSVDLCGVGCFPFEVPHQSVDLSLGFRLEVGGRRILYSGDSGWSERFVELSADVDLFLCECTYYERGLDFHLDYVRLEKELARLKARRLVLTHIGSDLLPLLHKTKAQCASDGLVIEI